MARPDKRSARFGARRHTTHVGTLHDGNRGRLFTAPAGTPYPYSWRGRGA